MLLICLTARCGSKRLPNKSLTEIEGAPLTWWLLKRYSTVENSKLVLATTTRKEDDALIEVAKSLDVETWRHFEPNDVLGRIEDARKNLGQGTKFIFRALGDCPFYATELLERAVT